MTNNRIIDYLSNVEKGKVVDDEMLDCINGIIRIVEDQDFIMKAMKAIMKDMEDNDE